MYICIYIYIGSKYRQTFDIKRTLVGDTIVDNSDVAPTTSSFST